jgi:gamma-glutamylcyclotransferase
MDSIIRNAAPQGTPTLEIPRPSTPTRSRTPSPSRDGHTLYFAYGSNLWRNQMQTRCPNAQYLGIARLRHWRWQINTLGYANIVEAPAAPYSPATAAWLGPLFGTEDLREDNDRVYGMVWRLGPGDEDRLDGYEDVGTTFTKESAWVEFWGKREGENGERIKPDLVRRSPQRINTIVYANRNITQDIEGKPSGTYRYKLNMGIKNAVEEGFPQKYIDEYLRPFVPMVDEQKAVTMAIEDAVKMGIDVQAVLKKAEEKLAVSGVKEEKEMQASQESLGKYLHEIVTEANNTSEQKGGEAESPSRGRALSSVR